jgi:hypothetical protein
MPTTNFPNGITAPGVGAAIQTPAILLPQTANKTIFTVAGGSVYVSMIYGHCTVAVGAVANATKLQVVPTAAGLEPVTAVDICATAELNALAAGTLYIPVTSFATAASITVTSGVGPIAAATLFTGFIMKPGVIRINCAGSDGSVGMIAWHMVYVPVSSETAKSIPGVGLSVTAAQV